MTVRAVLKNGQEVEIAPEHGATLEDVVANLTADGLTGSAAPLAGVKLKTTDGAEVSYSDVNTFMEDSTF